MAKLQWWPMDEGENHIKRFNIVKLCQEKQWQYININKLKIQNISLEANITPPSNNVSKL